MFGADTPRLLLAESLSQYEILNVLYFPFSESIPFTAKVMAISAEKQSVIFQYSVELRHQPIRARILGIGAQDW